MSLWWARSPFDSRKINELSSLVPPCAISVKTIAWFIMDISCQNVWWSSDTKRVFIGCWHQTLGALIFFKSRKNVSFSSFKEHRQQRYDSDLEVELAIDGMALGVEQLEGVRAVAVHVAVAVRKATVAEQEGHLRKNSQWERVCMQGTT